MNDNTKHILILGGVIVGAIILVCAAILGWAAVSLIMAFR